MEKIDCDTVNWMNRSSKSTEACNAYDKLKQVDRYLSTAVDELPTLNSSLRGHRYLSMAYASQWSSIENVNGDMTILQQYVGAVAQEIDELDQKMVQWMSGPEARLTAVNWDSIEAPNTVGATDANGTYLPHITLGDILSRFKGGDFPTLSSLKATADDIAQKMQDGTMTDRDWETVKDLSNSPNSGLFGALLYNQLPPAVVAKVIGILSDNLDVSLEEYSQRVEALGYLLGAASRTSELDPTYADQIKAVMAPEPPFELPDPPYSTFLQRDQVALSIVLSYGEYDTSFATTIADAVYDFDKTYRLDLHTAPSPACLRTPGGNLVSDAMVGIMTLLANNPDAAQDFFTSIVLDGEGRPQITVDYDRIQYLAVNRDWSSSASDSGNALGNAFESATTLYRNQGETGATSAEIATGLFTVLGQSLEVATSMPTAMMDSVANIAADYMADVLRVTNGLVGTDFTYSPELGYYPGADEEKLGFPPGMPEGALFTSDGLMYVFNALGQGADWQGNLSRILEKWIAADAVVSDHMSKVGMNSWGAHTDQNASTMSFIIDNVIDGVQAKQTQLGDEAASRKELLTLVENLIGDIPIAGLPEDAEKLGSFIWNLSRDTGDYVIDRTEQEKLENLDDPNKASESVTYDYQQKVAANWYNAMVNYVMNNHGAEGYTDPPDSISPDVIQNGLDTKAITREADGSYSVQFGTLAFAEWVDNPSNDTQWDTITGKVSDGMAWVKEK